MTTHEKAIFIIESFGIQPKKIAQIIKPSLSAVYSKIKNENGNKFTDEDLELLKNHILEKAKEVKNL
ncbi:hypothetical protein [Soonwooa sp.]|uniref:hypothetical protein n=1 Tax=Soonwooa sp. TaxID=1938592 RepID=UPI0028B1F40A|nr:hypothetical protein [Soonwooa sp.]